MILNKYLELATRAHYWTSQVPDERGRQYILDYSAELSADLAGLPEEEREQYQARYEKYFVNWLHAKSRCISVLVAGPSGMNVRRQAKANKSEHKHHELFRAFRERALRAIERRSRPKITPTSELDMARQNHAERVALQERMKSINTLIRKYKGNDAGFIEAATAQGISEDAARLLLQPDYLGRIGFPDYKLVNNGAQIRRLAQRVQELERKAAATAIDRCPTLDFEGGKIELNKSEDRIQIFHNDKPERAVIEKLKSRGFHWSPSGKCWQRKITGNAIYAAQEVTGVNTTSFYAQI